MYEGQFRLEIWKNHFTKSLIKRPECWEIVADEEELQKSGYYKVDSDNWGMLAL